MTPYIISIAAIVAAKLALWGAHRLVVGPKL